MRGRLPHNLPAATVITGRRRGRGVGYLYNHLATVVCGAFAAALSILWAVMVPLYPLLNFVFIMAVPITWFLVAMCWLAQKSTDYAHASHGEKKSLTSAPQIAVAATAATAAAQPDHRPDAELAAAKERLSAELDSMKDTVKLKDTEIARLTKEISDLRTLVQIESLRAELANLKALAAKR